MRNRITALERAFKKSIQPDKISLDDTRRKVIGILNGEIQPGEPPPMTPERQELINKIMEAIKRLRRSGHEQIKKD